MTDFRRLSDVEENRLARHACGGNQSARQKLFESQQFWVINLARKCRASTGIELDDLMQAGFLALLRSIDHFDPTRGTRLSSYATRAVYNAMATEVNKLRKPQGHRRPSSSSDDPLQTAIESEQRDRIEAAIRRLSSRWRKIVRLRMQGHTLKSIGQSLPKKVSQERVRQLHNQALARLRVLLKPSNSPCRCLADVGGDNTLPHRYR